MTQRDTAGSLFADRFRRVTFVTLLLLRDGDVLCLVLVLRIEPGIGPVAFRSTVPVISRNGTGTGNCRLGLGQALLGRFHLLDLLLLDHPERQVVKQSRALGRQLVGVENQGPGMHQHIV